MSSNPNSNNAQKDKEEDNIETFKEKSDIQKSEDSIKKENSNTIF